MLYTGTKKGSLYAHDLRSNCRYMTHKLTHPEGVYSVRLSTDDNYVYAADYCSVCERLRRLILFHKFVVTTSCFMYGRMFMCIMSGRDFRLRCGTCGCARLSPCTRATSETTALSQCTSVSSTTYSTQVCYSF